MLKQNKGRDSSELDSQQSDLGSDSLWRCNTGDLLERLASTNPTPGGGSGAMVVAAMGAALLKKAFAVSRKKTSNATEHSEEVETLINQLNEGISFLREGADRDAAAFEDYLRAVRLPHDDPAQVELRKKAIEEAILDATKLPFAATRAIQQIVASGLGQLPLVHKVVVSDALVGLRLLNASAACLMTTAEDNLSSLKSSSSFASLEAQRNDLRRLITQSELELERYIHHRAES